MYTENTVLVAEDEAIIRMAAAHALSDAGFVVKEAEHAAKALAMLQAFKIHLLMTDINMPGAEINGLELAHIVYTRWPGVALLIVSGHVKPAKEDMPPGAIFLAKPYDPNRVVGHARTLLAA